MSIVNFPPTAVQKNGTLNSCGKWKCYARLVFDCSLKSPCHVMLLSIAWSFQGIKQWDSNALFQRSTLVVIPSSAFFCREHNQQEKELNFPRKRRTMFSEFVSLLRWARRHVYQFFDHSTIWLLPYCESRLEHHFCTWSDIVSMNNSQYECKAPNRFCRFVNAL